jgi:hypothetical protein
VEVRRLLSAKLTKRARSSNKGNAFEPESKGASLFCSVVAE